MTKSKNHLVEEWRTIDRAIARLRAGVMAIVFGLLGGTGLFVATIWLVIRGPALGATEVGPTLGLLNNYFPGYEVTAVGSLLGFFYGTLTGAILGWAVGIAFALLGRLRQLCWAGVEFGVLSRVRKFLQMLDGQRV